MQIRGIIFDFDGTLADTLPVVVQAFQETFQKYTGRSFTREEIYRQFGPSEEGMVAWAVPDRSDEALADYVHRYRVIHREGASLFPGVMAMLKMLRDRGVLLAIVTGKGAQTAQISMEQLGLSPYFDHLVVGSPFGPNKPEGIREVLQAWGMPAVEAAYVGDMPYDMQAAREAGVTALGAGWAPTATIQPGNACASAVFDTVDRFLQWIEVHIPQREDVGGVNVSSTQPRLTDRGHCS